MGPGSRLRRQPLLLSRRRAAHEPHGSRSPGRTCTICAARAPATPTGTCVAKPDSTDTRLVHNALVPTPARPHARTPARPIWRWRRSRLREELVQDSKQLVAAVVPCYRPGEVVLDVLKVMPPAVDIIIVVDDACPNSTGNLIESSTSDPRVRVIRREVNGGVGAAMRTGYEEALRIGATIAVKIDSDGQMDPRLIPALIAPIAEGRADYVKGNRFFDIDRLARMPVTRKLGNAGLSFLTKLSSGYWQVMDPTNGFTAIHTGVLRLLPLDRIAPRYFFESDMLFRLGTLRAVVLDAPMRAVYEDEESGLAPGRVVLDFAARNAVNTYKRILYNYFVRGFSIASLELLLGTFLLMAGFVIGASAWLDSVQSGVAATAGTVMLAGLPIFVGIQLLLGFLAADMSPWSQVPVHRRVPNVELDDLRTSAEVRP
jgi:dolichol-phosphate mannosyltransferase